MGLQVVQGDRSPLLASSLARSEIILFVPMLPTLFLGWYVDWHEIEPSQTQRFLPMIAIASWSRILLLLLLVSTMRRRNGYAGVHELVTGTRTIARSVNAAKSTAKPISDEAFDIDAGTQRIGPYYALRRLGSTVIGYRSRRRLFSDRCAGTFLVAR